MFRKNSFLALHFSFFLLIISLLLCLLSAALFMLATWPFGPAPLHRCCGGSYQGVLIQLKHWSEYWCFPLNPRKCEASFSSVFLHQANLQPHHLLFNSSSALIPFQRFLGAPSTALLPFLNTYLCRRTSFFLVSRSYALSLVSPGTLLRSSSLFYTKRFFGPFSLMLHPDGFLFVALLILPN